MSNLELFVGQDFINSYSNKEYMVYDTQGWILAKAFKKNKPIIVSINRKKFALIQLNNNFRYIDNEFKKELDKKYAWVPEKNKTNNWEIYFTFDILEEYR